MMDCRPSDLVYIMSNPTTYHQLPVLLVKNTRYSRNRKNPNFDAKIRALQVEKKSNNNILFKCKLHQMLPEKIKLILVFFNFGFYQFAP